MIRESKRDKRGENKKEEERESAVFHEKNTHANSGSEITLLWAAFLRLLGAVAVGNLSLS
jgi:hypothetical protein